MTERPRFGSTSASGLNIDIAPLGVDHIAEARALHRSSFHKLCAPFTSESETSSFESFLEGPSYMDELAKGIFAERLFGARIGKKLVGTAHWAPGRGHPRVSRLRLLFVDPMFTRFGIGRTLLGEIEHLATHSGSDEMGVRTLVMSTGFFEANDYSVTSHGVMNLAGGQCLPVAFMRKRLPASAK